MVEEPPIIIRMETNGMVIRTKIQDMELIPAPMNGPEGIHQQTETIPPSQLTEIMAAETQREETEVEKPILPEPEEPSLNLPSNVPSKRHLKITVASKIAG